MAEVLHEAVAVWSPQAGKWLGEGPGDRGHKLVWRLFDDAPEATRHFLYQPVTIVPLRVVVRAARPPASREGWTVERTYPFAPALNPGDRLAFRVSCVPTRWRPRPGAKRGAREHLAQAIRRLTPGIEADPGAYGEALDAAARSWLASQGAKHGFSLNPGRLAVGGWQAWSLRRPRARPLAFDSFTFEGELTVENPGDGEHGFLACLRRGLGAERAFGFGLVQIRPAA